MKPLDFRLLPLFKDHAEPTVFTCLTPWGGLKGGYVMFSEAIEHRVSPSFCVLPVNFRYEQECFVFTDVTKAKSETVVYVVDTIAMSP